MVHAEEGTPLLAQAGPIATITLRRPSRRNSLRDEDLHALLALFARLQTDASVRVVVLGATTQGQERPVFSAGYDTAGFAGSHHDPRLFETVTDALQALRPLTLCALGGSVYGGATDLVLACDTCIAMAGMQWRMPAAAIGLHYYPGGLRRYVSRLGANLARRAFLTARPLAVEEIAASGLFDQVVPAADFGARVEALARQMAALAPLAAQASKCSLNELAQGPFDEARLRAREAQALASSDFAEGRAALAEKRAPVFTGR
jgi:enoyl-CoA hydratase/carnithine racemase